MRKYRLSEKREAKNRLGRWNLKGDKKSEGRMQVEKGGDKVEQEVPGSRQWPACSSSNLEKIFPMAFEVLSFSSSENPNFVVFIKFYEN